MSETEYHEYRALEQTIELISRLEMNTTEVNFKNILQYLQTLKTHFCQCQQCGEWFPPDAPMKQDVILEIWFCKKCYDNGAGL